MPENMGSAPLIEDALVEGGDGAENGVSRLLRTGLTNAAAGVKELEPDTRGWLLNGEVLPLSGPFHAALRRVEVLSPPPTVIWEACTTLLIMAASAPCVFSNDARRSKEVTDWRSTLLHVPPWAALCLLCPTGSKTLNNCTNRGSIEIYCRF